MFLIYPLCTPLYFFYELYRNRRAILDPRRTTRRRSLLMQSVHSAKWAKEEIDTQLDSISFLFECYRMSQFTLYAEIIDVYRRILLGSLIVFMGSTATARSLIGIVLSAAWVQVFDVYRPYQSTRMNLVAHLGNLIILFTFIMAFFVLTEPFPIRSSGLGWILLFVNLGMFAATYYQTFATKRAMGSRGSQFDSFFDPRESATHNGFEMKPLSRRPQGENQTNVPLHFNSMYHGKRDSQPPVDEEPSFEPSETQLAEEDDTGPNAQRSDGMRALARGSSRLKQLVMMRRQTNEVESNVVIRQVRTGTVAGEDL